MFEVYDVRTGEAASRRYDERSRAEAVATDACAGSGGWNYKVREVAPQWGLFDHYGNLYRTYDSEDEANQRAKYLNNETQGEWPLHWEVERM